MANMSLAFQSEELFGNVRLGASLVRTFSCCSQTSNLRPFSKFGVSH